MPSDRRGKPLFVIGAGGHAKVVISTAEAAGYRVAGLYDDDPDRWGTSVMGVPVLGAIAELSAATAMPGVIAIGDNRVRQRIAERLADMELVSLIHPAAYVHATVRCGPGTMVFAGAVLQPDVVLGAHVIINTGASVDHDTTIGDYVHLAPGVRLAGGVAVGTGVLLGIGSIVIPQRSIGAWAVVGAGGVVVHDLAPGVTAVGMPARPLPAPPQT